MILIVLPGNPIGKGRPRVRVVTPRGRAPFATIYTPKETQDYELALAWAGKAAMRGQKPLEGPVGVEITAYMPVPASWSGKAKVAALMGTVRPTGKPDYDNIGKIAGDALNGIVWRDDSQIVQAVTRKLYAESPRLEIRATPIGALALFDATDSSTLVPA